ncbi:MULTISPECIES: REP-associated tyrosine transposase [unclassified Pseudoalteromonas]|uniref:REP-associated tyrosine transposase n=1 Tax=unclassified Pseudoalteromonas TaxID=194690 RepID=UPI000CF70877|nr:MULTISPECIES: transposase [unclassified Pseudoalteromonas]
MSLNDLRKGRFSQANGEYFITFTCYQRIPFFQRFELATLFCWHLHQHELVCRCTWLTWVLMPDHFHGLLRLRKDNLHEAVGRLKGATAADINTLLARKGKVWQPGYFERQLRAEDDRLQIARYIAANPLRKHLASNLGQYPFWNSRYL